jgi:hypothetical protein
VAFISFSRNNLFSWLFGGGDRSAQKVSHAPGNLKVKEVERTNQALKGLLGFDEFGMKCGSMTGDKVVVDTGKKLVQIQADKLDLRDVRKGDKVDFKLDSKVDPGEATHIEGRVVVVLDGADPSKGQVEALHNGSEAKAREVKRPIDKEDPVADLVARRAELFQDFKAGALDQDSLKTSWDSLRDETFSAVVGKEQSFYEKQAGLQQLLDIGAFTPAEVEAKGIQFVKNEWSIPDYAST